MIAWNILRPFLPYLTAAVLASGGLLYVRGLIHARDQALALQAATERALRVEREVAAQARLARDVARAEAKRFRQAATEYNNIREWIAANDDDAPIPPVLRAALERMLGRKPD